MYHRAQWKTTCQLFCSCPQVLSVRTTLRWWTRCVETQIAWAPISTSTSPWGSCCPWDQTSRLWMLVEVLSNVPLFWYKIVMSGSPGKSLLHPIENRGCAGAGVPPQVFHDHQNQSCFFYFDGGLLLINTHRLAALLLHWGSGEAGEKRSPKVGKVEKKQN